MKLNSILICSHLLLLPLVVLEEFVQEIPLPHHVVQSNVVVLHHVLNGLLGLHSSVDIDPESIKRRGSKNYFLEDSCMGGPGVRWRLFFATV